MSDDRRYRDEHANAPTYRTLTPEETAEELRKHRERVGDQLKALETAALPSWLRKVGGSDEVADLRAQLAAVTADRDALRAQVPRQCQWTNDEFDGSWDTACGEKHVFTCDGPSQNHHRFCPYCGGHLIEMETDETRGST